MPGKLIGTNGFIDSSQVLLWPVKSDYFITEQYEMWAESKIPNHVGMDCFRIISGICTYRGDHKDNKKRLNYSVFF